MRTVKYNDDWKFWVDQNAFALVWDIPEYARTIKLPHDAMLERPAHEDSPNGGNTGYRDGGVYHYVKMIKPEIVDRNRTLLLKFEGVYMNAMVYIGGQLAAKCPNGYTGFYVALNDYLKYGEENEIRVIVRNSGMTNSRWYSGGGIYRDVYLLTGEETYIEPGGIQAAAERIWEDAAEVSVNVHMKNRGSHYRELRLVSEVIDADGETVAKDEKPLALFEGENRNMRQSLLVNCPALWSEKTPYLYSIRSRLFEGEMLVDESCEHFGIRRISADSKHGFCVNGVPVKLRGACIHHDSGVLGAATFYDAEYRRIKILKEAGFNAIRMAHHPAAPVLLQACDELGMYVMDEAFDMWERCKSDNDYGLFFGEWWEKDTAAMVQKDYNHPSVVFYSIGNEIPEIGTNRGAKICHDISEKIKELDPYRFTLASVNGVFAAGDHMPQIMADVMAQAAEDSRTDGSVNDFMTAMDTHMDRIVLHDRVTRRLDMACANTDIAGYNYMTARYESDARLRPNRVMVGSETYPPQIARNWELVKQLPAVIGDFTWTGWDYIGEAGVGIPSYAPGDGGFGAKFPCQLAYCGDIDITGFRRPASYYREIIFGLRKDPYIAVQNPYMYGRQVRKTPWVISDAVSSWSYPEMEGQPVVVEVYSPGEEVELFLNERSLGRKTVGKENIVLFDTKYQPGRLKAVAYEEKREIGRCELVSAKTAEMHLTVEQGKSGELIFVTVNNQDEEGVTRIEEELHIECQVAGHCQFWLGSGNPKPKNNYIGSETDTWQGRALVVIRKETEDPVDLAILSCGQRVEVTV